MAQRKVAVKKDEGKEQAAENHEEYCLESAAITLISRGKILNLLESVKEEVKTRGDREQIDGFIEAVTVVTNDINVIAIELEREVLRGFREFEAAEG